MKSKLLVAAVSAIALSGLLTACTGGNDSGGGGRGAAATAPVPRDKPTNCTNKIVHKKAPVVTVWAWYPNMAKVVDTFNKRHSDVQVCWTDVGKGATQYARLQTAVAAKKGAPDVVMLETDQLLRFAVQDVLVDLSQFGADDVKGNFSAGAWKDVSQGDAVYAIPVDGGPMAMIYRKDVFARYGITKPPATWDAYAADAAKVRAAGGPTFGDLGSDAPAALSALIAQKGAVPFGYELGDKRSITVGLNSQPARDVLNYWATMVGKGLVGKQDQLTPGFVSDVVAGRYATSISAAPAPGGLVAAGKETAAKNTKGKEKGKKKSKERKKATTHLAVAPLPQWDASQPVSVNWGGSAFAVTTQAADKGQAAIVAKGLYADPAALADGWKTQTIFPLHQRVLRSDAFRNHKVDFLDGQTANRDVYVPAVNRYQGSGHSPFTTYYYEQLQAQIVRINAGEATGDQAADALQANLVGYAKSQGYTVR